MFPLLVQRSDNSLCKMAAGHAFFGELRWGGGVSRLRPASTSCFGYSKAFVFLCSTHMLLACVCSECKLVEFGQVQCE